MTTLLVLTESSGQRLDQWLAGQLSDHSRSEIQRWIKDGLVQVDGAIVKASLRIEADQHVQLSLPEATTSPIGVQPEQIPLIIVYEDEDLLVIDKPAGMVVHPAPGHADGTLVNAVLNHCPQIDGVGGERRPGIVHRLDKDTSGLIIVAKNDRAHRNLQGQFANRTIYKEYLTLVEGGVQPPNGRISAPIGRHPVDRKRQAILPADAVSGESAGRDAVTDYRTLVTYHSRVHGLPGLMAFTLLSVVLHTGRTHQIRVHLAWRKHPVVGDTLYGPSKQRLSLARHFLHAHRLRFRLPSSGEEREFVSPLPEDLAGLLDTLHA